MDIEKIILEEAQTRYGKPLNELNVKQLYNAVSKSVMRLIAVDYFRGRKEKQNQKSAFYLSAEFLIGRVIYSNLLNLGLSEKVEKVMAAHGASFKAFEQVEDAALGNGGLGRLAACFLDSGAALNKNLDGYGIRYRYGLFKQKFEDGFQKEYPDDWSKWGDPWSFRTEEDRRLIEFKDGKVWAVPYDMPIVGCGGKINTLRLWQSEPLCGFDFEKFDCGNYGGAFKERARAESISAVLYPNDSTRAGKKLRLWQQYFFASASLQDILARFELTGKGYGGLHEFAVVQLNDTHPVIAIPELIRLLILRGVDFDTALSIAKRTFAYTNHTVMQEALEKWDASMFKSLSDELYAIVRKIDNRLKAELKAKGQNCKGRQIIEGGCVQMARLASYVCFAVNGVAQIHTDILKSDTLRAWYELYPEKFFNETNGVAHRRWLALANPRLSRFITMSIGGGWLNDLDELKGLDAYCSDASALEEFKRIKQENKRDLAKFITEREGVHLTENFIFDVQIKRLHEYKRQLLNALSIVALYQKIKDGELKDFKPTAFIFGAKAAPAYRRAKAIIKYINEATKLINNDKQTSELLKIVFVSDYNVSYAEKIVAAGEVSEQISTAGTEASGTGNMKLMMNGAVTLGTYDGANIEIAQAAGEENEYIFGARVEELKAIEKDYNPRSFYESDAALKRAADTLIDGTFSDGGTGMFQELYDSLLKGASWHRADNYFLFKDFKPYLETKLRLNSDYGSLKFWSKCLKNTAFSGRFSSDRTIAGYCRDIWKI